MKKRTTITTEKREIWIISEGDPQSHIPGPASTDRAEGSADTALVTTESSTTTSEMDDSEKE